jgi:hypothetical protein
MKRTWPIPGYFACMLGITQEIHRRYPEHRSEVLHPDQLILLKIISVEKKKKERKKERIAIPDETKF